MLKAFIASFRLRNTYKTNGIIYSLKSIPLVNKLLPNSLYASHVLKGFANIISIIFELFSIFLGKAIYMLFIYLAAINMKATPMDSFVHILTFFTIIGGLINNHIFNPTKDKYYAMFIMRMNPKKFTLANYTYFLLKMYIGLLIFSLIFGLLSGLDLITCIVIPLFVVIIKICITALSLYIKIKINKIENENKFNVFSWIAVIFLLGATFLPPIFGFAVSESLLVILTVLFIIPTIFALRYLYCFKYYKKIYKYLFNPKKFIIITKENINQMQHLAMKKKITGDYTSTSSKDGYKYFNELFMKRHAKLLTKSAKLITFIIIILFIAAVILLQIFKEANAKANETILTFLPYFLFVMYMINRGKVITQAMFMNCDYSMLNYRFYRQPKSILMLFIERLKYIIIINLFPAMVIAISLPILLYITGGTEQPLNYLLLFISIISMSIFFSVHNIVLYYLLQPYNVNLQMKSATYGIVNFFTYFMCYFAIGKHIPTLIFGTAVSAFCIIYAIIAVMIAYFFAPKTFKLRN